MKNAALTFDLGGVSLLACAWSTKPVMAGKREFPYHWRCLSRILLILSMIAICNIKHCKMQSRHIVQHG